MARVLVSGGAGFVGHHVIRYLLRETDLEIVSLDRVDFAGSLERLTEVVAENPAWKKRLRIFWHDLKSAINGYAANRIGSVDYILHLAASSHVDRSIVDPMSFVQDNVVGTCNILEFARRQESLRQFLYFGTDEVFGPAPPGVHFTERDRFDCRNPYSATKAGAEELSMAYGNTYGLPVIATHTMNVYGIRQHPEKFIPLVMRKVLQGERVIVHASPDLTDPSKRHYLEAEDLGRAVLFLMNHGESGERYNVVAAEEQDNLQLALLIAELLDRELDYELVDPMKDRPRFDHRYACDGSKLARLGWTAQIDIRAGLERMIPWTLDHPHWLHL